MMTLSVSDLLSPERVLLDLGGDDEISAIRAVTALLEGDPDVGNLEQLTAQVLEREALSSTALGSGVAFPHARTDQVSRIVVSAGRCPKGVLFRQADELVHFIFVIATPRNQVPQYLSAVGRLARLLNQAAVRDQLMRAGTAAEFLAPLQTGG